MVVAKDLTKEFIKTEKVKFKTQKTRFNAVDGISLTANDGETLGIIGPNGAGKTTLLRMLGTLMEPTSGTVEHYLPDGTRLDTPEQVKRHMGYLSNNTKLHDRFSIREYLEALEPLYGFTPEETAAKIEEVIVKLDMASFADSRISGLSTGQTQRASISRCLFADPQLYILDEPTLGLDIMSSSTVVSFIQSERERGKTILYSTHYMEEAQTLCDRVILINRGRIIACGTPAALCVQTGRDTLRGAFLQLIGEDGGEQ